MLDTLVYKVKLLGHFEQIWQICAHSVHLHEEFLQFINKGHIWDETIQYLDKFLGQNSLKNLLSLIKDTECIPLMVISK